MGQARSGASVRRLLAVLLLGIVFQISAGPPGFLNYTNSLLLGATGSDNARAVAAGSDGAIYVAGSFDQTIATPGGPLTGTGLLDGFLVRIGPNGSVDWGIRIGGGVSDTDEAYAVAVDGTNVYVGGYFQGTAAFTGTNITAQAGSDAFLASFNTNGTFQWVRQIRGSGDESIRAIAVTPGGIIKVTGYYTLGASWDTLSTSGAGMFLLSVDTSGQLTAVQTAGSDNSLQPGNLIIANDGTVLVSGRFVGTALGHTSVNVSNPDAFLAAFGSTGNYQWSFAGGGTNLDDGVGLALATDGSVILGCLFSGTVTYGGKNYTSVNGTWLGQFNTAGSILSSNVIDGASVTALATGKKGIVHVSAAFSANFSLGGVALNSGGGTAVAIASYLISNWELEGVSTLTSTPQTFANKSVITADDGLAIVGFGQQSVTFDGTSGATSSGTSLNALVVRLTPPDYKLTVTPQGGNLLFTYPAYYYDATLQTNAALPGTWGDAPATVVTNMGFRSITVSTNSTTGFYRLKR